MKTTTNRTVVRKGADRKATAKGSSAKQRMAKPPSARTRANRTTPRKPSTKRAAGKHVVAQRAPAHGTGRAAAVARKGPLVIDATNVICGLQNQSRLDLLLSMVVAEAGRGCDVLCIFDATTPHRLGSSPERDLYRWLLQEKSHHFIQCPGRTEADLLILAEADRMACPVVSNDFFRDREERYPWVRDRGRVLRHQPIRDVLYLGDRPLPVETDLMLLRRLLERLFPNG
jgi:hypothetical protein